MLGIVEQQRCIRLHGALHLRLLQQKKNAWRSDCVGRTVVRMLSGITRQACVCVWRRICQRSLCLPFRLRVCIQWYLDITSLSLYRGSTVLHLRNGLSGWLTTVNVFFNSPFQTHHLPWETTIISPILYLLGTQRTNKDQQQNNLIDFLL